MVVERIYIGGLDPPRLCAKDVLDRLESIVELGTVEDRDKSFVHFTAEAKEPNVSALEAISKQYHNVKWKGCRLAVAAARPHFLERLQEEIRQRTENKEKGQEDDNSAEKNAREVRRASDKNRRTKR